MKANWSLEFGSGRSAVPLVLTLSVAWLLTGAVRGQVPRTATAEASIGEGCVVRLALTDAGACYGAPPTVTLSGGGGSGATAIATVRNGAVDRIALMQSGAGYSSKPAVTITAPVVPMLESVSPVMFGLTIRGQVGATHHVEAADAVGGPWTDRGQVMVSASPYQWLDEDATGARRFYRVRAEGSGPAPAIDSAGLTIKLMIRGTVGTRYWILGAEEGAPWRVLGEVAMSGELSEWMDTDAAVGRQYQISMSGTLPVEPDPRQWSLIEAGRFTMGSPPTEPDRRSTEGPQTTVTISQGFWMGKYEVTQGEYLAVMGTNPSRFTGDTNRPVEKVSWNDATNYCGKLTAQERAAGRLPAGHEYRLPTEAQWEYACRAGTTTRYSFGDALECDDYCACPIADQYMWWCGNDTPVGTKRVGQKPPNAWGLYDMHGNVWEWCADRYQRSLPGGSVTDPTGPTSGSNSLRVFRGGCYGSSGPDCRSAVRIGYGPSDRSYILGFRVALARISHHTFGVGHPGIPLGHRKCGLEETRAP